MDKTRVLKHLGNGQYCYHADFANFDDAIKYVDSVLVEPVKPIVDKSKYSTRYDFYHFMILSRN